MLYNDYRDDKHALEVCSLLINSVSEVPAAGPSDGAYCNDRILYISSTKKILSWLISMTLIHIQFKDRPMSRNSVLQARKGSTWWTSILTVGRWKRFVTDLFNACKNKNEAFGIFWLFILQYLIHSLRSVDHEVRGLLDIEGKYPNYLLSSFSEGRASEELGKMRVSKRNVTYQKPRTDNSAVEEPMKWEAQRPWKCVDITNCNKQEESSTPKNDRKNNWVWSQALWFSEVV